MSVKGQFIAINSFLIVILVLGFTSTCNGGKLFRLFPQKADYYYPRDTGHNAQLNSLRCSDYKGHRSGKSRWPFKCFLPASHLATGRLYDGTSIAPEQYVAPPWINLTLFEEGQRFAKDNSGHLLVSSIYGIFITNLFLDSKELSLFTGKFNSPESSARTNIRIANEIFNWYRNAPPATDLPSFEDIAQGIRNVRRAHRNVTLCAEDFQRRRHQLSLITPSDYTNRSVNSELWNAFMRDVGNSPIPYENRKFPSEYYQTNEHRKPLNQFIQAITLYGFVGIPVLYPERVGLTTATDEELFAFNHLWAVLAYCVGIKDEYNISLQPDLRTTRKYFQDIFETFIQPAFFQVDFFAKVLVDSLLEGANLLDATMTPTVTVTRILSDVLRIPAPNTMGLLNSVENLSLSVTGALLRSNGLINKNLVRTVGENILGAAEYYENLVGGNLLKSLAENPNYFNYNATVTNWLPPNGLGWNNANLI